jgi:hypothetical protein
MVPERELDAAQRGVLLTGSLSPLAIIARDLSAVVDSLEAEWLAERTVRPETASRLREIINRAQQITDLVE